MIENGHNDVSIGLFLGCSRYVIKRIRAKRGIVSHWERRRKPEHRTPRARINNPVSAAQWILGDRMRFKKNQYYLDGKLTDLKAICREAETLGSLPPNPWTNPKWG